jgi:transposase
MASNTTFISDDILARGGDQTQVFFKTRKKKSKKETTVKRKDGGWASEVRPRLSYETRKALSEATWSLKKGNVEYDKLSRRKTEIARRSVNHVVDQVRWFSQCKDIAIVIEDLNVSLFHGGGHRAAGWDQFFTPKKENRWFMQVLHKAFSELAPHRGLVIIEINPMRTSRTCPACEYCDEGNRVGEQFACLKCKKTFHADLEVAPHNILRVAMTGQMMPKAVEQEGAAKKSGSARKRKRAEVQAIPPEPQAQPLEEHAAE